MLWELPTSPSFSMVRQKPPGPSKVERPAVQRSISMTNWTTASGGVELVGSLGGRDNDPTIQTAHGRRRSGDSVARPPPYQTSPAGISGCNHEIAVELLSHDYGQKGAGEIES
jgi:hypothetical protein